MTHRHPSDWIVLCGVWFVTLLLFALGYAEIDGLEISLSGRLMMIMLAASWTFGVVGMRRFKSSAPDQYLALGAPQFFGSPYVKSTWKLLLFLFSFSYLRIADGLAKVCFSVFIVGSLSFLITILLWN